MTGPARGCSTEPAPVALAEAMIMIARRTLEWKTGHPKYGTDLCMPRLEIVGVLTERPFEEFAPHVAAAMWEFLPQLRPQLIREFAGGILVVTCQQPDSDVRQLVFSRE